MTWALIITCFVDSLIMFGYGIYKKGEKFGGISILLGLATIIVAVVATAEQIF